MSCPECEGKTARFDWRYKVGLLCFVAGLLLNFVHLSPGSGMQKYLEFFDGLFLGLGLCFIIVAFFRSRKNSGKID